MFGGDGGVVGHVPALVLAPVLPPDLLNDDLSAQHESLSIWHQTVLHYTEFRLTHFDCPLSRLSVFVLQTFSPVNN